LSLMVALIPFIARRVVSGDLGSTMFAALSLAGVAVQTAAVALAGFASGLKGGGGGPDPDPPGPPPPPGDSAKSSSNRAPKPPDSPGDKGSSGNGGSSDGDETVNRAPGGPNEGGQTQHSGGGGVRVRDSSISGGGGGNPPDDNSQSGGGSGKLPDNHPPKRTSGSNSAPRGQQPHVSGLYYVPSALSEALGTATGQAYRKIRGPRNSGKE
jgi:hypothetical protein